MSRIADGRRCRIVKVYHDPKRLHGRLRELGWQLTVASESGPGSSTGRTDGYADLWSVATVQNWEETRWAAGGRVLMQSRWGT